MSHPRDILLGAQAAAGMLPVCDHYSGVEVRMRKSLQLQAEMSEEFGTCVFDVTLDCEDGAPVGGEEAHARLVTELVMSAPDGARVGVRVHPVDHPAFEADMDVIARDAGQRLTHIMIPKAESVDDVARAEKALVAAYPKGLPLQVLIESPGAVHRAFDIAAHPRVQSLSFGLMDLSRRTAARFRPRAWASKASSRTPWCCAPSLTLPRPRTPSARCPRTAW